MKKAFVLAELLLAIAIIGVIAVLTVPNVIRNAFTRANIATLQQTYAKFPEVIQSAMLEQRVRTLSDFSLPLSAADETLAHAFVKRYFDFSKDCGTSVADCFSNRYKDISGTVKTDLFDNFDTFFILANGASIALSDDIEGIFVIDVNNVSPPNVLGRDLFYISINGSGDFNTVSGLYNSDYDLSSLIADCRSFDGALISCIEYLIMNNWKMDY